MTTRRRVLAGGLALGTAIASAWARAQPSRPLPRVAFVGNFPKSDETSADPSDADVRAILAELRKAGLADGRNVVVVRRSNEGDVERVPAIMRDLVAQKVDVIVTSGGPSAWAAHKATDRIPIVAMIDDVGDMGILDSLARPGHNLTGVGETDPALHGKRLQILKEAAPSIKRLASICYTQGPNDRGAWRRALDAAGRTLRVEVVWFNVDAARDYDATFAAILDKRIDSIYATPTHVNGANAARIADFALEHRMPSLGFPAEGMLIGYWSDEQETYERVAAQVKKIVAGARPGDLPFEQPAKFSLIVNRKTARALGLTIPRSMMMRATEIIG